MFEALKNLNVFILLLKCHFIYSLMKLLRHHVCQLDVFMIENKNQVIKNLAFFTFLMHLKNDLKLFKYYYFFIHHYVAIIKLLKKLKIICLKSTSLKSRVRKNFVNKHQLCNFDLSSKMFKLVDEAKKV